MDIFLYNSLTRKKEKFEPINPPNVGIYTCGPTVYQYVTIGNFRTYATSDFLVRVLKYNRLDVKYVMNITDVGHLTGDNIGDADTGEDRMEKAAQKEGKNAWDIANFYTKEFLRDYDLLRLVRPDNLARATEHIDQQIDLVKRIEERGFVYRIKDGIYFDTEKFEKETGKKYGELSTLDKIKEGARVEKNPDKKDPRDFALWKFSETPGERQMEWDSPWGLGFPGWHIECSAMSMNYLGESFDIHVGGEDLRQTHHPNEIAQSEAATGKKFVNYWIHSTFLKVDGKKMSKSLGNVYTVSDIKSKGFDPLALRYLFLTAHYRDSLNFTWKSLRSASAALSKLRQLVMVSKKSERTILSQEKKKKVDLLSNKFQKAVNDDLDTPRALTVLWEAMKSNIPSEDKYDLAMTFDEILGLGLREVEAYAIPEPILRLAKKREDLRKSGNFEESDKLREELEEKGYIIKDTQKGPVVEPKT